MLTESAPVIPASPAALKIPPGPPAWDLLTFFRAVLNPERDLPRLVARYGDPFTCGGPMGTLVISGDPGAARALFTADPATFSTYGADMAEPIIGARSVLMKAGAGHRADRRILTPPFHGARMRAYGRIMQDVARRRSAGWREGGSFAVQDTTQVISLEVIVRAVFGITDAPSVQRYEHAICDLVNGFHPAVIFTKALRHRFLGLGPWSRFLRARETLDALLYGEIARRRAHQDASEDILGLLLATRYEDGEPLSAPQIRDHLLTLLFAGHETTGISLAWALYWIHRHPEVRARLLAELASLEDVGGAGPDPDAIAALPYLEAVCHETLRLHPVIPVLPGRQLLAPLPFPGGALPAGIAVTISPVLVHQRPELYPQPGAFRPERFLERSFSPFEYLPFGGGNRRCIGAAFALYEMKLVLAELLRTHKLALISQAEPAVVRRNLSTGPAGGVRMTLVS